MFWVTHTLIEEHIDMMFNLIETDQDEVIHDQTITDTWLEASALLYCKNKSTHVIHNRDICTKEAYNQETETHTNNCKTMFSDRHDINSF